MCLTTLNVSFSATGVFLVCKTIVKKEEVMCVVSLPSSPRGKFVHFVDPRTAHGN